MRRIAGPVAGACQQLEERADTVSVLSGVPERAVGVDGVDRALEMSGFPRARHGPPRSGRPMPAMPRGGQAVTACLVSLLVTWMVRGLAASRTGMVRVSTPAA